MNHAHVRNSGTGNVRGSFKICIFIAFWLANSFFSLAYANPYVNTFENQKICYTIQFLVRHLSPQASATEWPMKLEVPGVSFPSWQNIDPAESLNLIEENYQDRIISDRNFDIKFYTGSSHFHQYNQSDLTQISKKWVQLVKPNYLAAISQNRLEFQSTEISGILNLKTKLVAFRYRYLDREHSTISASGRLLDADLNWQYIIRIYNKDGSFKDYTISLGLTPVAGELAILQHSIILFVTNSSVGPDLAEVYLPPPPFWWPYGGLAISDACPIAFSK